MVCLLKATEMAPLAFTLTCSFLTVRNFTEYCRKVYFAIDEFSAATFIIANGGLYYLFNGKAINEGNPAVKEVYLRYRTMCGNNLATALGNMNFFVPATMEYVEALLLGVSFTMTVCASMI